MWAEGYGIAIFENQIHHGIFSHNKLKVGQIITLKNNEVSKVEQGTFDVEFKTGISSGPKKEVALVKN